MWRGSSARLQSRCRTSRPGLIAGRRGKLETTASATASAFGLQVVADPAGQLMEQVLYRDRQWCTSGTAVREDAWHVQVASYNILADTYAQGYSNWLYRDVPQRYLTWHHRCAAIAAELAHWLPDVVCCQEVDHYHDLAEHLAPLGYQGAFLQRSHGRTDGCATFWRPASITPIAFHALHFTEHHLKDNVALYVAFQAASSSSSGSSSSSSQGGGTDAGSSEQERVQRLMAEVGLHSHVRWPPTRSSSSSSSSGGGGSGSGQRLQPGSSWRAPLQGRQQQQQQQQLAPQEGHMGHHTTTPAAANGSGAQRDTVLLVGNTHIIFQPSAGEVKLGQARVLLETAQQLVRNLSTPHHVQQKQRTKHQHMPPPGQGSAAPGSGPQDTTHTSSSSDSSSSSSSSGNRQVFTVLAGDFNAEPNSPLYHYIVDGQLDLNRVDRGRVADPTQPPGGVGSSSSSGAKTPKGYRGWGYKLPRSAAASSDSSSSGSISLLSSVEEGGPSGASSPAVAAVALSASLQKLQVQQEAAAAPSSTTQEQQQQQVPTGPAAAAATSSSTAASTRAASVTSVTTSSTRGPSSSESDDARCNTPDSCSSTSSSGYQASVGRLVGYVQSAASGLFARPGTHHSSHSSSSSSSGGGCRPPSPRTYRWSESDVRRASGHSTAHLAAAASSSFRPPSAAATAAAVTTGAPATASSPPEVASPTPSTSKLKPPRHSSNGSSSWGRLPRHDKSQMRPLLMTHDLPLRSSYLAVCGNEPDYTSSHTQFMDTCDYIWYTPHPSMPSPTSADSTQHSPSSSGLAPAPAAAAEQDAGPAGQPTPSPPQQLYELQPMAVLLPPDGGKLPKGLPAQHLGSDHVMLVTRFQVAPRACDPAAAAGIS